MGQSAAVSSDYEVRPPSSDTGDYEVRAPSVTANQPEKDWRDKYTRIEPHHLGTLLPQKSRGGAYDPNAYVHEGTTALSNLGAGLLGIGLHPVATAENIAAGLTPKSVLEWGKTHGKEGELRAKQTRGETLTDEEKAYLDRAEELRNMPNPLMGTVASFMPKAVIEYGKTHGREGMIRAKQARGEKLTPDEQAYLDNAQRLESMGGHPLETAEQMLGQTAAIMAPEIPARGVARGIAGLRETAAQRFGPRSVELAGKKVPVLVGEANPESIPGRMQASLKRAGTGAAKFDAVTKAQQAAVKDVIRRTAQQTSGLIGPMAEEPGAVMADAADATFAKARPMYGALDDSLKSVPATFQGVSKIVQDAVGKARRLGVDIDASADESLAFDGKKITPKDNPELWQKLKDQGIVNDAGEGTPLTAYIKVRSQLLKMQRSASDAAVRNAIGNEVRTMNDNMETALKGTPLYENWTEANRLWSKGYALRDVAKAIKETTRGTPAAEQAPGLTPVQTRIQGASLVKRLNTLKEDGILSRAFAPEEEANLRQAADILDRARAAAGSGGSFTHGYSLRSVIWRAIIKLPTLPFVNAMTTIDGLETLKAAEAAKTPGEVANALYKLANVTAVAGAKRQIPQNRKEALEQMSANAAMQ
jgi:hypothetical protein